MQHVMYNDIMSVRRYIEYPYFEGGFDIENDECLYCFDKHKHEMRAYLENYANTRYIKLNVFGKIDNVESLSDKDIDRFTALFSAENPSVRLAVYSGAVVNREKILDDINKDGDIKRVLIELTGELNAAAIDGLLNLYAASLKFIEDEVNTDNTKTIKEYYTRLITTAYVYMKKGAPTDFFLMPLSDILKAIDTKSTDKVMESASNFLNVYIKNNVSDIED